MRYVIIGAGAIGATIGGRLAEAGRDVVLVARGAHERALRTDGLHLALPDRELHLKLPACTVENLELRAQDVLILAVKSQHSEGVIAQLAAKRIDSYTAGEVLTLVCAQNGISNEDTGLRFFANVIGMCVNLPATHLEPGHIDANGWPESGILQLGRYPVGSEDRDGVGATSVADLQNSGFMSVLRDDVMAWKRAKLVRNLGNALEVLCPGIDDADESTDSQRRRADLREVRRRNTEEAKACFEAAGMTCVTNDEWNGYIGDHAQAVAIGDRPRQGGSTWQSIQRGQGSVETDFLNGEIARLGRLYGVPTPINVAIQAAMRIVDTSGSGAQPIEPADLLAESVTAG
ncbi:MAG: 2-dehydropantoate 2-reductase [Frankiales bacterium]|nr:2-dehydropantoate 2-reductase [Frankiales bacterium]